MEVSLTDDQAFFRETTRRFLGDASSPTTLRGLQHDPDGMPPGFWKQGTELGWTSLLVAEDHGGGSISGNGVADLTIVADAFGRHAAPGPLIPTNVVAETLSRRGTDEQRAAHLDALLCGELVAAWCWGTPRGGLDELGSVARTEGQDVVLSGMASPVEAGTQAGLLLVSATSEAGPIQVLVPSDVAGAAITPLRSVDLVRRYARVELDEVRVSSSAIVGEPGDAAAGDIERQLQSALVVQTAEMVGAAEAMFDVTVEWAFDRYSFGRPLASYQELKHRFADMKMWLEASHGLADALAREVADEDPSASATASAAKAYLGEYLPRLLHDCVQIHGGIGLTADHDLHLFLRRVTADRSTYGVPAEHRQRVAAHAAA